VKQLTLIGFFGLILATSACDKPATSVANAQTPATPPSASQASTRAIAISVDASGYHPGSVRATAGKPARLVFTRTSDEGCGHQLVFPTLGIRKDLPLNQPVTVDITIPASGSVAFTCGMNMLRGSVVVE
jgi:plastocyanin domain-containing protein